MTYDAARVAAGSTGAEFNAALAITNVVAVTGAKPNTGVIGWLIGGGHGPFSTTYGMSADDLLEATIVTPVGQELTDGPCQNSDLFFAIREGGGGTCGVVKGVVVRTYPSPKTASHIFEMTSLNLTIEIEFYEGIRFLHAEMQRLKDGGMQGYYLIVGPPPVPKLSLA